MAAGDSIYMVSQTNCTHARMDERERCLQNLVTRDGWLSPNSYEKQHSAKTHRDRYRDRDRSRCGAERQRARIDCKKVINKGQYTYCWMLRAATLGTALIEVGESESCEDFLSVSD